VARTLEWPPGSIVVMDRGYLDYRFLDSLEDRGVFFVTRLKERALYSVEAEFSAPKGPILADQMICLPGRGKNAKALRLFRRVVVWDEVAEREIVLLTNNVQLAASTIAAIYKSRWQIELFFKALKQNLKIKTFVGTTPNAVRIQMWTALIAILVLKYLQMRSRLAWSLSNLLALLRLNLFVHRDLWAWVDEPFAPPPQPPLESQTTMAF
jgi:IS4 transposase